MKTLYIEGTSEADNGNLRKAFSLLLEKELSGNMPRIIMGDGKNQTKESCPEYKALIIALNN